MKVGLITTWNERCGLAEYAKNLTQSLDGEVEFKIIDRPLDFNSVKHRLDGCDIAHVNYEAGLFQQISPAQFFQLSINHKTVCTWHTSFPQGNRNRVTEAFHKVVVHETTSDGGKFCYIPHGIYDEFPESHMGFEASLGTCGFPFNWKGWDKVAIAAKKLGVKSVFVLPESRHVSAEWAKNVIKDVDSTATVITDWLPQKKVIDVLSRCEMLAFPYLGGNGGISGAVRMGLATRRPVMVSRCRQFRDLFQYSDELYFIENTNPSPEDIIAQYNKMLEDYPAKKPNRIIQDMGWKRIGQEYKKLYEELIR